MLKIKNILRIIATVLIFTCIVSVQMGRAQKTLVSTRTDLDFIKAKELYEKEKYGAAIEYFVTYLENENTNSSLWMEEASYLHAMCAVELYQNDAQYLLYNFIKNHPASPILNEAVFELGKLAYRDKQYGNCLRWLEEVEYLNLEEADRTEYYFMKGYSHFRRKEYEEARVAFYEILESDDRHAAPATYYYSHIQYEQKNYETSLKGFLSLSGDETFSPIVPYYVTQIYYLQKKWDDVISYAPDLLKSVTEKRYPEMVRILGEAYFNRENYPEAVKYLSQYHDEVNFTQPEDKYMMGFAYYMTGDYEKAMNYFRGVSLGKDELAQSALYHLADCYVKLGDKYQARLSFAGASRMDFDPEIKEDALFNYAIVTYELGITPFNEAVQGFSRYISLYPASDRTDEAYNYLVLAFMGTKNYRAALAALEKIRRKTPEIERSYQRVAFFRGLELFNDLSFMDASNKFEASLKYGEYDPALKALCYYWMGESQYRLKDYDMAIRHYQDFLQTTGAIELREYAVCHYNIAYCEFKKGNHTEALAWFKRFESIGKERNKKVIGDAYNRIGDMYYIDARYKQAIEYYDKAIANAIADVDYALFQKAVSLGIMDKYQEKIGILAKILKDYQHSNYLPDALYETGRSYFILQKPAQAIPFYVRILDEYPSSSYVSKALIQLGLIYYNQNETERSLAHYKRVVDEFPGTSEANNALMGIKTVYLENNQVNEYFAYVQSLGRDVDISMNEQDSLSYLAAENIYLEGNCTAAIPAFENYISTYESGAYLLSAHFYKAECQLKEKRHIEALASLNYIIEKPRNMFTEPALLTASRINTDYGNYREALENFLILEEIAEVKSNITEAKIGKMRTYYLLKEYGDAIDAARKVLREDKISDELIREARYDIAKSFYAQDRFALALEEFRAVASEVSSVNGAESKYRVAEILFIRKEYKEAEEVVFEFIDLNTPHQFWMAKSFLLLSDIYLVEKDVFQAVQTLQSIIDFYEKTDDGLLDLARRKKAEILKEQENQEGGNPEEEIEVEMEENGIESAGTLNDGE